MLEHLAQSHKENQRSFAQLGKTPDLPLESSIIHALEEFVCLLYRQKGSKGIDLPNLRWELFTASQVEAQKLPPTKAALLQHILRAAYQSLVWAHLEDPKPDLPPPDGYGWKEQGDTYIPVITTLDPAPLCVATVHQLYVQLQDAQSHVRKQILCVLNCASAVFRQTIVRTMQIIPT